MNEKQKLREVAALFLKLVIGFEVPAHISMMRGSGSEKWLEEQHFLDLIGATNLILSPGSTEMAIHMVTKEQGGRTNCRRLLFHSSCSTITGIFAWLYKDYGHTCIPYGIKPAIIAIILGAIFFWQRKKTVQLGIIGIVLLLAV
jgi:chromate transporter